MVQAWVASASAIGAMKMGTEDRAGTGAVGTEVVGAGEMVAVTDAVLGETGVTLFLDGPKII